MFLRSGHLNSKWCLPLRSLVAQYVNTMNKLSANNLPMFSFDVTIQANMDWLLTVSATDTWGLWRYNVMSTPSTTTQVDMTKTLTVVKVKKGRHVSQTYQFTDFYDRIYSE